MDKYTIEYIREEFAKEKYIILSSEYVNVHSLLSFRCVNGHIHKISFCAWRKGQRCKKCIDDTKRLSIEYVRMCFENEGYKLLNYNYVNNRQRLDVVCKNGHTTYCTFDNFKSGFRCKYCAKNVRHTIEFVRYEIEKEGYTLLTDCYINQKQRLKYICPVGHENDITWTDWYNGGYRCPICWSIRICGCGNHRWMGGKSFEPYCDSWSDKEYKESIKFRDGYKCLNPCCKGKDRRLHIHHIDYNKKNCVPKNLITLCGSCNTSANNNRKWHKAWYQAIMYRRYNHIY